MRVFVMILVQQLDVPVMEAQQERELMEVEVQTDLSKYFLDKMKVPLRFKKKLYSHRGL